MNSNISMVEARLPPGFRFHPKDDELVCDYLMKKVTYTRSRSDSLLMIEVDLNKCEPWDIPEMACVGGKEWYFYSQRDRKYATGLRTNRATASGYWKATGKDRPILRKGTLVGMRKTLVFYQGRAPKGRKTEWVMHEFRIEGPLGPPKVSSLKEDWVLCRVFYKSRDISSKVIMGNNNCQDNGSGTASSSLPPLTDSYIAFNHSQAQTTANDDNHDEYEQVPCFSIVSHNQVLNPILPHHLNHLIDQPSLPLPLQVPATRILSASCAPPPPPSSYGDGAMPELCYSGLGPYACDQKVLKAVLNQITKMDTNIIFPTAKESPSLGEGSSESFLSEVGMPNMWDNQY